ncbi:hypothetical protein KFE25_003309 [Diacronema lutheri]|uniref:CRM domain-containing protein n=2 Tax=Diacronema lutheri TaxID=2081491 RepID=A0A8J5X9H7_DIALT|nr:hypothetical protein KFE25_003309 [Diacronema lutheri]
MLLAMVASAWLAAVGCSPTAYRALARPLGRPLRYSARVAAPRITASDADAAYGDELDGRKRRALRALAGRLAADGSLAVLNVLGVDYTAQFLGKIDRALDQHELIKLRMRDIGTKKELKLVAEDIATGRGAHVAQIVGHTALLYRARHSEVGPPRIVFFDDCKSARMEQPLDADEQREVAALDAILTDERPRERGE